MKNWIAVIVLTLLCMVVGIGIGFQLGSQFTEFRLRGENQTFKELVIDYLEAEGVLLKNSHFVFETIDRRENITVVAGMLRTTEPDRERVGRFWIELKLKEGTWVPGIVQTKTIGDYNAESIRWP